MYVCGNMTKCRKVQGLWVLLQATVHILMPQNQEQFGIQCLTGGQLDMLTAGSGIEPATFWSLGDPVSRLEKINIENVRLNFPGKPVITCGTSVSPKQGKTQTSLQQQSQANTGELACTRANR